MTSSKETNKFTDHSISMPLISIAIPTYNREYYLSQAIESVLRQSYPNIEIIISDNASTDHTEEVVNKYLNNDSIKYYKNTTNIGMVPNWRKILYEYVTGDWLLILSDDDYFVEKDYIYNAVKLLQKDDDIVMVYSNGYILYENSQNQIKLDLPYNDIELGTTIFINRELNVKPIEFTLCNVLFNTKLARDLDAFSNDHNISCDSELFLKSCLYGKVGVIKEYTTVYRFHEDNLINKLRSYEELLGWLDVYLSPYKLALEKKCFDPHELEGWKRRLLIPLIKVILMEIALRYGNKYCEFRKSLKEESGFSLRPVWLDLKFMFRVSLYRNPTLYKLARIIKQFGNTVSES